MSLYSRNSQSGSRWTLLAVIAVTSLLLAGGAYAETILLDASQVELEGGWNRDEQKTGEVRMYVTAGANAKGNPAAAGVEIPHAGKWRLWVRSKDFPQDRPGSRNFTVRLGNAKSTMVFGKHGKAGLDGWEWEDGGVLDLPGGPNLLVLGDAVASSARCDAILLTDNMSYQPEGVPWKLGKQPATMVPLTFAPEWASAFTPSPVQRVEKNAAATLKNERLRISFLPAITAAGAAVTMHIETKGAKGWQVLDAPAGTESYRVLYRPETTLTRIPTHSLHPRWDSRFGPVVEASLRWRFHQDAPRLGNCAVVLRAGLCPAADQCPPSRCTDGGAHLSAD